MEVLFACGVALISAAVNVYIRDTQYLVESAIAILFWLVPIFYPFSVIPDRYQNVYQFNPVAAIVLALRYTLLENTPLASSLLTKLALGSTFIFIAGWLVFQRAKQRFYDYL